MNFKSTIFLILLISSTTTLFAKNASLSGKVINNIKYEEIYLQDISFNTLETQKPDKDGNFKFDTKFNKFDFYLIAFDKENYVIFFPEPGEQTVITIDLEDIKNPEIINSVHSDLYYKFNNKLETLKKNGDRVDFVKKMINENPNSPTCIFFINILNTKDYFSYHEKLSEGLSKYSYNKFIKDYITKTENAKKLIVGNEAPDIVLNDPDGKTIKLSSLRGQYVLIDFWASWCGPCRMENPNNVKLYNKYHDKGFEIYAVSLDKNKNSWLKAIKDDNLAWIHVSDLKYWKSEGAKIYNVTGIPHTVLLDKEGKIIANGLRGNFLKLKLEEIFRE